MIISLIYAADENNGIARNHQVPWYLPDDLKRFKSLTMGHHILMGRKTYQSIGKPLPGRTSILLSRQEEYVPAHPDGYTIQRIDQVQDIYTDGQKTQNPIENRTIYLCRTVETATQLARLRGEDELFVIGGGEVYTQCLSLSERIYLTRVHAIFDCDVFAPEINLDDWDEIELTLHPADQKNAFASTFHLLSRTIQRKNS